MLVLKNASKFLRSYETPEYNNSIDLSKIKLFEPFSSISLETFEEVLPPLVKLISGFWELEFDDDIAKKNCKVIK